MTAAHTKTAAHMKEAFNSAAVVSLPKAMENVSSFCLSYAKKHEQKEKEETE